MPGITSELICSDWHPRGGPENSVEIAKYRALDPGVLYYYTYTSNAPPEPLAPFSALQTPAWNVSIYDDAALGWIIRIGKDGQQLSPPTGTSCIVHLDGAPHRFDVVDAMRRRVVGGRRTDAGGWEDAWDNRRELLLHSPDAPASLREWLDAQLDLDAHMASLRVHLHRVFLTDAGIPAFMQALERPLNYRLQLDRVCHAYRAHKRG
jgi:hypothetical protein